MGFVGGGAGYDVTIRESVHNQFISNRYKIGFISFNYYK